MDDDLIWYIVNQLNSSVVVGWLTQKILAMKFSVPQKCIAFLRLGNQLQNCRKTKLVHYNWAGSIEEPKFYYGILQDDTFGAIGITIGVKGDWASYAS